jgi:hypothetical protein
MYVHNGFSVESQDFQPRFRIFMASLSKEDMFDSNVLCTAWARVRAGEEKFMAVLYIGSNQLR